LTRVKIQVPILKGKLSVDALHHHVRHIALMVVNAMEGCRRQIPQKGDSFAS
jgi:hypothetical protein